jgi:AraC-like DNA-binding protein
MQATYHQFKPSNCCRSIVEEIWVQESPAEPDAMPTTIPPNGRIELVIHFGDPFELITDAGPKTLTSAHIAGQQHNPVSVKATGKTGVIIVRFYPWSASSLMSQPLPEFTDSLVDLPDVWPETTVARLKESVHSASTPRERAAAVDAFICAETEGGGADLACKTSIDLMNKNWGRQKIDSIAAIIGLSRRQLARRFSNGTGTSPKKMSRLLRAQKAITCIRNGVLVHDVVGMCGYADQSHLIHDVVTHTGKRPSELAIKKNTSLEKHFNAADANGFCGIAYL